MGRKFIGIFSAIGFLVNLGFWTWVGVSTPFLAMAGEKGVAQFIEMIQSVLWVGFALPLAFMMVSDVKLRNQVLQRDQTNISRSPVIWGVATIVLGPLAGIGYWYLTRNEQEVKPVQTTEKLSLWLSILTFPLTIVVGILKMWSGFYAYYMDFFVLSIVLYLGLNGFIIYRMRQNNNYSHVKILIFSFILLVILWLLF